MRNRSKRATFIYFYWKSKTGGEVQAISCTFHADLMRNRLESMKDVIADSKEIRFYASYQERELRIAEKSLHCCSEIGCNRIVRSLPPDIEPFPKAVDIVC